MIKLSTTWKNTRPTIEDRVTQPAVKFLLGLVNRFNSDGPIIFILQMSE